MIDALQRRQQGKPVLLCQDGPSRSLEPAHRLIAVDAHDQHVAQSSGGLQTADVPGMNHVEAAVAPHHRSA